MTSPAIAQAVTSAIEVQLETTDVRGPLEVGHHQSESQGGASMQGEVPVVAPLKGGGGGDYCPLAAKADIRHDIRHGAQVADAFALSHRAKS